MNVASVKQMSEESGGEHAFGEPSPVPGATARETVDEMVEAGLLDDLMSRVDDGGLRLTGEGGFLPEMIKRVLERGLQAELSDHLGYDKHQRSGGGGGNSRNGSTPKTVRTEVGHVDLDTPSGLSVK
jgi:putative transposase